MYIRQDLSSVASGDNPGASATVSFRHEKFVIKVYYDVDDDV